jgi:hypothetical protein
MRFLIDRKRNRGTRAVPFLLRENRGRVRFTQQTCAFLQFRNFGTAIEKESGKKYSFIELYLNITKNTEVKSHDP